MPEGPEVKITSDFLNDYFQNEVITEVLPITQYFKTKYSSVTKELKEKLIGEKINSFTIGKRTYIPLANKQYYQYHLGMTGYWSTELTKHSHFKLSSKNKELYFCDVRKFGNHRISLDPDLGHIVLYDPLRLEYDINLHHEHLTKSIGERRNVCNVLLDQNLFPGVGNYLKSEILYKSGIHPDAKWGQISKDIIYRILKNSKKLCRRSYQNGGAELKDFRNPQKQSSFNLEVYAKKTDPNGSPVISMISKDNRRTWFVPEIQKLKK